MNKTFNGTLIYNDNGQFEIHNGNEIVNITEILDNIFQSQLRPLVYVKVMKGDSLLFEEDGGIFVNIDRFGINCFYICGMNLDALLLNHENEFLEIIIKREGKLRYNGKKS
jgi:hypothetical protein